MAIDNWRDEDTDTISRMEEHDTVTGPIRDVDDDQSTTLVRPRREDSVMSSVPQTLIKELESYNKITKTEESGSPENAVLIPPETVLLWRELDLIRAECLSDAKIQRALGGSDTVAFSGVSGDLGGKGKHQSIVPDREPDDFLDCRLIKIFFSEEGVILKRVKIGEKEAWIIPNPEDPNKYFVYYGDLEQKKKSSICGWVSRMTAWKKENPESDVGDYVEVIGSPTDILISSQVCSVDEVHIKGDISNQQIIDYILKQIERLGKEKSSFGLRVLSLISPKAAAKLKGLELKITQKQATLDCLSGQALSEKPGNSEPPMVAPQPPSEDSGIFYFEADSDKRREVYSKYEEPTLLKIQRELTAQIVELKEQLASSSPIKKAGFRLFPSLFQKMNDLTAQITMKEDQLEAVKEAIQAKREKRLNR